MTYKEAARALQEISSEMSVRARKATIKTGQAIPPEVINEVILQHAVLLGAEMIRSAIIETGRRMRDGN